MPLASLFRRKPHERAGFALYTAAVGAARDPGLFAALAVPDSLDGRFDLIGLEVALLIRRLRQDPDARGAALAQAVFDAMFADMDMNLREMGVSDLSVGRRVKTMWEAFHGRAKAYDSALTQTGNAELMDAIIRNIYRGLKPSDDVLDQFCAEIRALDQVLAGHGAAEFKAGRSGLLARGES